jgi:serine/threonine protein phosphatase PrpC
MHGAWLFIIADGMGGHRYGAHASRTAGDGFSAAILNMEHLDEALRQEDLEALSNMLFSALHEANDRVFEAAKDNHSIGDMGTTLLAAIVLESGDYVFVYAGDSRAYVIDEKLHKLHFPHNYTGQMLRVGACAGEEDDLKAGQGMSILLQSLGNHPAHFQAKGGGEANFGTLKPGQRLLLCSDGIWGEMKDEVMRSAVATADNPTVACSALLAAAYAVGASDNISAIVVEIES